MEDPLRAIARQHGVFLRREAIACGYTDKMLASLRRQGVLHRVRHGCYCFADVWSTMTPEERHLTLARAVLRVTPGPVVLSHVTALIAHGVSVWGADLARVDVTRLEHGAGRVEPDVRHHVACAWRVRSPRSVACPWSWSNAPWSRRRRSSPVSRRWCRPMPRCTRRSAIRMPSAASSRDATHWSGSRHVHTMIRLMDGRRSRSGRVADAGSSRPTGLPMPDLQYEVVDEHGVLIAVTDYVWHEHRHSVSSTAR